MPNQSKKNKVQRFDNALEGEAQGLLDHIKQLFDKDTREVMPQKKKKKRKDWSQRP